MNTSRQWLISARLYLPATIKQPLGFAFRIRMPGAKPAALLLQPLRELFRDAVRKIGLKLGL